MKSSWASLTQGARLGAGATAVIEIYRVSSCEFRTTERELSMQSKRLSTFRLGGLCLLALASLPPQARPQENGNKTEVRWVALTGEQAADQDWIPIFNGNDLEGWEVKLAGHELNDNFGNTFRVEDGLLKVSYDQYAEFGDRFGHIFLK